MQSENESEIGLNTCTQFYTFVVPIVFRWRKLEGSDPATYEMIQKVKALQKRLIQKTEEVVEKDLLIQEKEKLYVELKVFTTGIIFHNVSPKGMIRLMRPNGVNHVYPCQNILARQPGPEVSEQLTLYQQNLKEKTKQLQTMASELNMYHAQVPKQRLKDID